MTSVNVSDRNNKYDWFWIYLENNAEINNLPEWVKHIALKVFSNTSESRCAFRDIKSDEEKYVCDGQNIELISKEIFRDKVLISVKTSLKHLRTAVVKKPRLMRQYIITRNAAKSLLKRDLKL